MNRTLAKDTLWELFRNYVESTHATAEGLYQSDRAQCEGLEMIAQMLEATEHCFEYDYDAENRDDICKCII